MGVLEDFERDTRERRNAGRKTEDDKTWVPDLIRKAQAALENAEHVAAGKTRKTAWNDAMHKAQTALNALRKAVGPRWKDAFDKPSKFANDVREWMSDAQLALDGIAAAPAFRPPQKNAPTREWLIPGWLPAGRVTRFTSQGGTGKSYMALELAAAIATGAEPDDGGQVDLQWREGELGAPVLARSTTVPHYREGVDARPVWGAPFRLAHARTKAPGSVLFLTWEDERAEIDRRLERLPSGRGAEAVQSGRILIGQMERSGPLWAPVGYGHISSVCTLTETGRTVEAQIRTMRPHLVVIDPIAAAFAGNENDRAAVRRWLSHLNAMARETDAAILLISHPPKAGGADYSGSTDWDNGVRAAWTLELTKVRGLAVKNRAGKDAEAKGLSLALTKANYARAGTQTWLRWTERNGRRGLEECTADEAAEAHHGAKDESVAKKTKTRGNKHRRKSAIDFDDA